MLKFFKFPGNVFFSEAYKTPANGHIPYPLCFSSVNFFLTSELNCKFFTVRTILLLYGFSVPTTLRNLLPEHYHHTNNDIRISVAQEIKQIFSMSSLYNSLPQKKIHQFSKLALQLKQSAPYYNKLGVFLKSSTCRNALNRWKTSVFFFKSLQEKREKSFNSNIFNGIADVLFTVSLICLTP